MCVSLCCLGSNNRWWIRKRWDVIKKRVGGECGLAFGSLFFLVESHSLPCPKRQPNTNKKNNRLCVRFRNKTKQKKKPQDTPSSPNRIKRVLSCCSATTRPMQVDVFFQRCSACDLATSTDTAGTSRPTASTGDALWHNSTHLSISRTTVDFPAKGLWPLACMWSTMSARVCHGSPSSIVGRC